MGVRSLFIDEVAMTDMHLASSELYSLPHLRHGPVVIDWHSASAILTNHFSIPADGRSHVQEFYWSEWTALFGHLLSTHRNVLNPPNHGSWCGPFPTIFDQISIVEEALRCEGIVHPTPREILASLWGKGGLRDVQPGSLFSVPATCYWSEGIGNCRAFELVAPFVDEVIVCPDRCSYLAPRLRPIANAFQRDTGCRIGQLRLFSYGEEIAFHSISARPNPDICLTEVWANFSLELISRILPNVVLK